MCRNQVLGLRDGVEFYVGTVLEGMEITVDGSEVTWAVLVPQEMRGDSRSTLSDYVNQVIEQAEAEMVLLDRTGDMFSLRVSGQNGDGRIFEWQTTDLPRNRQSEVQSLLAQHGTFC